MWNRQANGFSSLHRLFRLNDDRFYGVSIRDGYDTRVEAIDGLLNCHLNES